jgi:Ca2+-transporting ATPase
LPNPYLHVAVLGGILLQVAVASSPFVARLLGNAALPIELWPVVFGVGVVALGGAEIISRLAWRDDAPATAVT